MKSISLPKLVKKTDIHFSRLIRERDKDNGCITCNKWVDGPAAHAGHFIVRGCKLTRFDPRNVNLQCSYCNTFRDGEQYKHGVAIDKKFGEGTAVELVQLEAQYKSEGHKYTREFLQSILELKSLEGINGALPRL